MSRAATMDWETLVEAPFVDGIPKWQRILEIAGWDNIWDIKMLAAWRVYFLMRGGIERPSVLLRYSELDFPIDWDELFLVMDNAGTPPSSIPITGEPHVFCRGCGQRMNHVPCGVCRAHRRGEELTLSKPAGETMHDKLRTQTFGTDRHWKNASSQISASEYQYHGDRSM